MSLEEQIAELTAAVKENTAALKGSAGKAAASSTASTGTGKGTAAKKPKNSADQVKNAVLEVKEKVSADAAKKLIEDQAGSGKKLADLLAMPDKFDATVEAANALVEGGGDEEDEEGL